MSRATTIHTPAAGSAGPAAAPGPSQAPAKEVSPQARRLRFEFQCRMLEQGFHEIELQIGRLDDIALRMKAGAATVWTGLVGWSFTAGNPMLIPLGFVVILGFWLLEAMIRGVQARFIRRSQELAAFVNDREALDDCFERCVLPEGVVHPVGLPETEWRNVGWFLRSFLSTHVATLYLFLGLANLLAWLAADLGLGLATGV